MAAEWRCFHCDELFTTTEAAIEHFGRTERQSPACQIDIARYRDMEQQVLACVQEDSEVHREMHGLLSDHQLALVREEERGYARGLQDAKDHPEDLGLQIIPPHEPANVETLRTALDLLYNMGRDNANLADTDTDGESARRADAVHAALVTLFRLGMGTSKTQANMSGGLPYWASPNFNPVIRFLGDEEEALSKPASSTLSPAEIDRRTTIAFESTNPSNDLSLQKYWYGKGLREGAEIPRTPLHAKSPAERAHITSLLAFVTMGFHARAHPTIADAQEVWDSVTRPDGPLAWVPDVLTAKHTATPHEDTARLDYIEATNSTLYVCAYSERRARTSFEGGYETVTVFDGWCMGQGGQQMPTVREAIDAGRFPQQETADDSDDSENHQS